MRNRTMAALCLLGCATPALASDPAATAAAFGARENVQQISLSPDGTHVAMIVPTKGRGLALLVGDIAHGGDSKSILRSSGDPENLTDCHWSTDTRIVCRFATSVSDVEVGRIGYTRLVAIDSDGRNLKLLSAPTSEHAVSTAQQGGAVIDWLADGDKGAALVTRSFVAQDSGTLTGRQSPGFGVEQVDTTTLARRVVEPGRANAVEYISDGHGTVRVMGTQQASPNGYVADHISYSYRRQGSKTWEPLGRMGVGGGVSGFNPYAVDRDLNVVYGFDDKDGRRALFKVKLDGSLASELVLARPDVDVDGLIRIGRQDRVVGASFVTDKRETRFFDPQLRVLSAGLGKALPHQPLVTFIDASADESKLLLYAGGDTDPGQYYMFDKATKHLGIVAAARAELAETKLAPVKPITFPAADGTPIPGYLTLPVGSDGKNLPTIVMPHGGPGARDEWGFDWLSQYFVARGYAVLQPNFRGSTGYGQAWFQKNGFQSWRTAIGDVDDAGRWLVKQGIADPKKMAIVGWSYGGYAALQSGVTEPGLYKAIVAIAPVTDLDAWRQESAGFTNYALMDGFIGHGAHIREGSPARNAERIAVPVLMFHGDRDTNVGVGESRLMASKLRGAGKSVDFVEFKGLDHQLDDESARTTMLGKADSFLRASMGM